MKKYYSSSTKYVLFFSFILIFNSCSDTSPVSSDSSENADPIQEAPNLISPSDEAINKPSTLSLRWDSLSTADSYELQISESSDFSNLVFEDSNLLATSYTASDLNDQTKYYWRVRAKNDAGVSSWSSTWTFTVEQVVKLSDDTKVLPEETVDMISDTTAGLSSITFKGSSNFVENLQQNEILIMPISSMTPNGALKRIIQINRSGNNTTIITEQATLVEAFEEAELEISMPLAPGQVKSTKTIYKGVKLDSTNINAKPGEFYIEINDVILHDGDGDKVNTLGDQFRVNGSISFKPTLNANLDIDFFKLKTFRFDLQTDFNSDIKISSEVAVSGLKEKYPIKTFTLQPVSAGYVVIVPQIEIYVGTEGKISIGLTSGINYASSLNAGIEYINDDWSPIADFDNSISYDPVEATAEAAAEAYSGGNFVGLIYGIAGPYVNLKGFLRLDVEPISNPWWSLFWGLEAGTGAKIKLLSKEIANHEYPEVIGYEDLLAQAEDKKENPELSFSPSSFNLTPEASESILSITNSGSGILEWEITSDATWLSFDPGSGTGEKDVKVSVLENTTNQQRNSEILITSNGGDSEPIPVMQQKAETQNNPVLSYSPSSFDFSANSGLATLSIENTGSGTLEWQVSTGADWLSFTPSYGNGNTDVEISYTENTSNKQRTADITITSNGGNSESISVTQQKADTQSNPILSYSPSSFDLSATSGLATLFIENTGSGTLEWQISSEADWLSFTPASGTGNTDVEISYTENTTNSQRTAEITITSNGGNSEGIPVTQQKPSNQNNDVFYLAENGITIKCPDAYVGEKGTVNGVTYTKRIKSQITTSNAATTCTSGVTDMYGLFSWNDSFNQDISSWDVSSVTDMSYLFFQMESFNQDISAWDVSNVTSMFYMFRGAESFNQPIGSWDVGNVTNMVEMFLWAKSFNQNIGDWDVSNVTDMARMFMRASSFNQNISEWCVTNISSEPNNFSFDAPLTNENKPVWGTCPE